jgi:integrase
MPKPRSPKLESATSRRKLPIRKKPFQVRLAPGIALAYRRNAGPGTWSVRVSDGFGGEWLKKIGLADDLEPAAPPHVLSYWQAQEVARKLARRQPGEVVDESRPLTVAEALDAYEKDLKARGASKYNAGRVRLHLSSVLVSKPIELLDAKELKRWRDSLIEKLAPASVNRTIKALRAALEIAADHDPRITNQRAWKVGLAILPGAAQARNVILADDEIRRLVAASYACDQRFGLFVHVLAESGARASQVARLTVDDLKPDPVAPKLAMPKSAKGGSHDRLARKSERYNVPVSSELARRLAQQADGHAPDDLLLVRSDGQPWGENPSTSYRKDFAEIVAAVGLNPETTAYSLRHSSICRALLAGVPIRLVASGHDTSSARSSGFTAVISANRTTRIRSRGRACCKPRRGLPTT